MDIVYKLSGLRLSDGSRAGERIFTGGRTGSADVNDSAANKNNNLNSNIYDRENKNRNADVKSERSNIYNREKQNTNIPTRRTKRKVGGGGVGGGNNGSSSYNKNKNISISPVYNVLNRNRTSPASLILPQTTRESTNEQPFQLSSSSNENDNKIIGQHQQYSYQYQQQQQGEIKSTEKDSQILMKKFALPSYHDSQTGMHSPQQLTMMKQNYAEKGRVDAIGNISYHGVHKAGDAVKTKVHTRSRNERLEKESGKPNTTSWQKETETETLKKMLDYKIVGEIKTKREEDAYEMKNDNRNSTRTSYGDKPPLSTLMSSSSPTSLEDLTRRSNSVQEVSSHIMHNYLNNNISLKNSNHNIYNSPLLTENRTEMEKVETSPPPNMTAAGAAVVVSSLSTRSQLSTSPMGNNISLSQMLSNAEQVRSNKIHEINNNQIEMKLGNFNNAINTRFRNNVNQCGHSPVITPEQETTQKTITVTQNTLSTIAEMVPRTEVLNETDTLANSNVVAGSDGTGNRNNNINDNNNNTTSNGNNTHTVQSVTDLLARTRGIHQIENLTNLPASNNFTFAQQMNEPVQSFQFANAAENNTHLSSFIEQQMRNAMHANNDNTNNHKNLIHDGGKEYYTTNNMTHIADTELNSNNTNNKNNINFNSATNYVATSTFANTQFTNSAHLSDHSATNMTINNINDDNNNNNNNNDNDNNINNTHNNREMAASYRNKSVNFAERHVSRSKNEGQIHVQYMPHKGFHSSAHTMNETVKEAMSVNSFIEDCFEKMNTDNNTIAQAENSGAEFDDVSDNYNASTPIIRTLKPLSQNGRYIIVGDVHGCVEQLERLIEKVKYVDGLDRLIVIGDYVNKGPDSIGVIRLCQRHHVIGILGNHDFTLINCIARNRRRTYTPEELRDPVKKLAKDFPLDCEYYLRRLPHIIRIPECNLLLVHAGLNPQHMLAEQSVIEIMHLRRLEEIVATPEQSNNDINDNNSNSNTNTTITTTTNNNNSNTTTTTNNNNSKKYKAITKGTAGMP